MTIDAAVGESLDARDAYKLIDDMALSQQQWSSVRDNTRAVPRILETDLATKVAVQNEAKFVAKFKTLQKSLERMTVSNVSAVNLLNLCAIYGAKDHLVINCGWGGTSEWEVKHENVLNNKNF
jgi:hypothetical protein